MGPSKVIRYIAATAEQEYLQGAISSAPLPDEKAEREISSLGTSLNE
jgi:hypothetical protein